MVEYAPAAGANAAQFAVVNTPGKPLPNTGGLGTLPIYFAGALLVALAVVLLARRRYAI